MSFSTNALQLMLALGQALPDVKEAMKVLGTEVGRAKDSVPALLPEERQTLRGFLVQGGLLKDYKS